MTENLCALCALYGEFHPTARVIMFLQWTHSSNSWQKGPTAYACPGFERPDVWVVGYGLDYADMFRTLPYIAALRREVYESR